MYHKDTETVFRTQFSKGTGEVVWFGKVNVPVEYQSDTSDSSDKENSKKRANKKPRGTLVDVRDDGTLIYKKPTVVPSAPTAPPVVLHQFGKNITAAKATMPIDIGTSGKGNLFINNSNMTYELSEAERYHYGGLSKEDKELYRIQRSIAVRNQSLNARKEESKRSVEEETRKREEEHQRRVKSKEDRVNTKTNDIADGIINFCIKSMNYRSKGDPKYDVTFGAYVTDRRNTSEDYVTSTQEVDGKIITPDMRQSFHNAISPIEFMLTRFADKKGSIQPPYSEVDRQIDIDTLGKVAKVIYYEIYEGRLKQKREGKKKAENYHLAVSLWTYVNNAMYKGVDSIPLLEEMVHKRTRH
jgi:hypothetical protein